LQPLAITAFALGTALILAIAGPTLGYDYHAYANAAHRLLDGQPLYDATVSVAGGFAIFLYPPPFAFAMLPFALLPGDLGLWAWLAGLIAAFLAGVSLLPVRREVRWAIVLLAGLSWPYLYSIKLGQVGPLLFLAFAVGWRFLAMPRINGSAIAVGALIKVQPALLFGWLLVTRRWRAFAIGVGVCLAAAIVVTPFIGLATWADYVALLRRVSTPVTTPHNFTPGAVAYQLGVDEGLATLLESAAIVGALVVSAWAWFRAPAVPAYLVTVVASQLISPLLWDHYAMLLLLPTAFLLDRRHWWAAAIPFAGWLPPVFVPAAFAVCLVAPLLADRGRPVAVRSTRELRVA
jgi:hypothetical protein